MKYVDMDFESVRKIVNKGGALSQEQRSALWPKPLVAYIQLRKWKII